MTKDCKMDELTKLLDELRSGITSEELEAARLLADIRESVALSTLNPAEDETHEEKARRIMMAFIAGAARGDVSKELLQWAGLNFARFLSQQEPTLDHAFRVADRRESKHQITERKHLDVINAYRQVIDSHCLELKHNDDGVQEAWQHELTRDALIEAEHAAYVAYHDGMVPQEHVDWERRFGDTIKPILESSGNYIPRSSVKGRAKNWVKGIRRK